jgi:hypothetical protein
MSPVITYETMAHQEIVSRFRALVETRNNSVALSNNEKN